jgi:hypothetical protein
MQGPKATMGAETADGKGRGSDAPVEAADEPMDASERLVKELARVRAKFAMDPADLSVRLAEAWTSPTAAMEEDEAEFVDALADCLGAGLPLEAALSFWDSGELAYEEDRDDEEGPPSLQVLAAHHAPGGRRFLVR